MSLKSHCRNHWQSIELLLLMGVVLMGAGQLCVQTCEHLAGCHLKKNKTIIDRKGTIST